MTINQKLAVKIRKLRNEMKISQEQLAELADLHRTYIGQIERAEKNITLRNLEKIAIALKTTITKLLDFSDIT